MADVVTFDPDNLRIIEINVGSPAENELEWFEIYSEWKDWLLADASRLGYPQAFRQVGSDPISPIQNLGSTLFLGEGWKFRPAEYTHKVKINGNVFVEGGVGSVVVPTLGAYTVLVETFVSNLVDAILANSAEIQYNTFGGAVHIDEANGTAGTAYDQGTPMSPVNNFTDALTILNARGFDTLHLIGDATLVDEDVSGLIIHGQSQSKTTLTVQAAADVTGCEFHTMDLIGPMDGLQTINDCHVGSITGSVGHIRRSDLGGPIVSGSGSSQEILDCYTGSGAVTFDLNGAGGGNLILRDFSGDAIITESSIANVISIQLDGGSVTLDATLTAGTVVITGTGKLTDNSGPAVTVDRDGLISGEDLVILKKMQPSLDLIGDLVESQRGHHTFSGTVHYVDGFGGNDTTGDGTRTAPYQTISKALTQVTTNGHDLVYLLANAGASPTVVSESATIDVAENYVFIRGPGRDVSVTNVGVGDVFNITGNGVELSGFQILAPGAAATGVKVSGADFVRLHALWIVDPFQDCIEINVGTNCQIERCQLIGAGRDGVRVTIGAGAGYYTSICDSVIRDAVGSAVRLGGADASEARIQRNVIRDNGAGVRVIAGTVDTVITDNRFINNAGGDIVDGGTRTLAEWNSLPSEVWSFIIANAGAPISGLASGSAARFLAENNLGAVGQVRLDYTTDPVEEHYYDFDGALLLTRYLETNVVGEKATTQAGVQTKRLLVPTP